MTRLLIRQSFRTGPGDSRTASSRTVAGEGATAPDPGSSAAAIPSPKYPQLGYLVAGFALFIVAGGVGILLPGWFGERKVTFKPLDGVSAFALFFLAAAVVERLLEPFAAGLVRATPQKSAPSKEATGTGPASVNDDIATAEAARGIVGFIGKAKADALTDQASFLKALVNNEASDRTSTIEKAAAEGATADQAVVNGTFIVWAVASLVAVVISWYFGLSLPLALGVTGTDPVVDRWVTALMIGAGTKPLHDLFNNLQKSSQNKSPAQDTSGS